MKYPPMHERREMILTMMLVICLILFSGGMAVFILTDSGLSSVLTLASVATEVEKQSAGNLDWDRMFLQAVHSMTNKLDRFSFYIEPRRFQQMDEEFTGSYGGIGVSVIQHDLGLLIMSVREHGPSYDAGLLNGDLIIKADSIVMAGLSANQCTELLRGKSGTSVKVTIYRTETNDSITADIIRQQIDLLHIPYAGITIDSFLYIRLLDFGSGTADDVEATLDSLMSSRPNEVKGVILDLRGNPGGLFTEAYKTANLFLEEGKLIVGTDGRSRWRDRKFFSSGVDKTSGLPMAIIVDRGSASAAEIVAGSLRQQNRAVLIGDTTFGKGLVQGFSGYEDGSGLRMTVSRYFLEGNVYLNKFDSSLNDIGHGLVPDYYLTSSERDHFARSLENSQLLREFASIHQSDIIFTGREYSLANDWISKFISYANEQNFQYISPRTSSALFIVDQVQFGEFSSSAVAAANNILSISRTDDSKLYERHSDFILFRLRQLAFEREYGLARTYADVIIPQNKEIQLASEILRDQK